MEFEFDRVTPLCLAYRTGDVVVVDIKVWRGMLERAHPMRDAAMALCVRMRCSFASCMGCWAWPAVRGSHKYISSGPLRASKGY